MNHELRGVLLSIGMLVFWYVYRWYVPNDMPYLLWFIFAAFFWWRFFRHALTLWRIWNA